MTISDKLYSIRVAKGNEMKSDLEIKKEKLTNGGFIHWQSPYCSEEEREELRKLGKIILHYGGITTASLQRT